MAQVHQDLAILSDLTLNPVEYLIKYDPERVEIEKSISDLETADCPEGQMEAQATMMSDLYDMLEDEGTATIRAVKILKDLGFR